MAIHPIDLQTLYTQLDKVGKAQAFQENSLNTQQSLAASEAIKKQEQQQNSVNEIADSESQSSKIGDKHQQDQESQQQKKQEDTNNKDSQDEEEIVSPHDPRIGSFLDITG